MATVCEVCTSKEKGTRKKRCDSALLVANHGIRGDAHAGDWHRQISLLALEQIEAFRSAGADVEFGAFGENLVVQGLCWENLSLGTRLRCGEAILEITQFGKECHDRCHIYKKMGDCIMPRHGVFAKVIAGGTVRAGDTVDILKDIRVALLTVSDKASRGERADVSGATMRELVEAKGMKVIAADVVEDERETIAATLVRYADADKVDLVLTSGGTGFSPRDVTPEATILVIERLCPGIPEAMRALSLSISKRAMLSRATAGIRGRTLVVNLPGSPRAVRECLGFIIDELIHGIEILSGKTGECGS